MKKIIAMLLALVMVFALAACGNSGDSGKDTEKTPGTSTPADTDKQPESKPITIKLQGAFAEGAEHYYYFEQFCKSVNERSNGTVTVVWGSGPEAIPTDQLAEAMQNGIVEMVYSPCTYLVTHAAALRGVKLTDPSEMRANGGVEYLNSIVSKTLNCQFLARMADASPYVLTSTKEIKSLDDFKGMVFRGTAAHKPILTSVGAEMTSMGWGDVYSALDRNTIEGAGGTIKDFVDNSLGDKIGYLIDPGLYCSDASLFISNAVWEKLDDVQKKAITDSAIDWEVDSKAHNEANNAANIAALEAAGTKVLKFEGEMLEQFVKGAYDAAWAEVEAVDAEVAKEMRSYTSN